MEGLGYLQSLFSQVNTSREKRSRARLERTCALAQAGLWSHQLCCSRCAKPGEPRAAPTGMGQERPPHAAIFRDGTADLLGICAQLSFSSLRIGLAVPGGAGTLNFSSCLSPQLPNAKEGIGLQLRSKDAGRAQPGIGCPLPHLAVLCHTWLSCATPGCPLPHLAAPRALTSTGTAGTMSLLPTPCGT